MKSGLAEKLRNDVLEAVRRMPPERRLQVFAEHCRRVAAIARVGAEHRARKAPRP